MKYVDNIKLSVKTPALILPIVPATAVMTYYLGLPAAALIGVLLAGAASFFLVRSVTDPLQTIKNALSRLTALEFTDVNAEDNNARGDEIGEVGKAVTELNASLKADIERRRNEAWSARFKSSAFEGSTNAMMVIDRDFKVIFINDATKKLLADNIHTFRDIWPNFDPDKIIGSCIDMFHKKPEHQRQMLSDPTRLPYKTDISVGDLKFELDVRAVKDRDGEYVGNVLQWNDVTTIRTNDGILNALDRSQAVIEFTLEGKILHANKNFLDVTGYSLNEIIGRHHSIFVDRKEASSPAYKAFWEKLGNGEFDTGKYKRVTKAGEDIWIQAAYNPILDGNGKPFKVVKFATDITQTEITTNENSAKISAIGRSQAVIEFELDGTIITANDAFLSVMGYTREEIVGKHHRMFAREDFAKSSEYHHHWERLRNGEFIEGKFERVSKDGKEVWIQASYNPLFDLDGKPYKVIKYASDVTHVELERRRNEEERAQKAEEIRTVISQVGSALRRLSDEDYSRTIEEAFPEEFEQVRADINTAITKMAEAERQRDLNEKQMAKQREEQSEVVRALASALESLSEGDLAIEIEKAFPEGFDQLRLDFNSAISKLCEAMRGVVICADGIKTGAGEITQASDDLSRRTEGQAATLEQTAASLEQLTVGVKAAAEGADRANGVVSEAKRNAEDSGEVVRQAVTAMSEIEKSSEQISQIISVIDDISFQTNLLALNAGVEAARAGDAGLGFAVVAKEVGALAQRSSTAAKEIKVLIKTSSQHVEHGVDLVGQAGKALTEIVASVTNINELVSAIATSAKEQSTGIAEINIAVNQLDQVTQQNAAMVEESTAASHSMAQEAQELARMVATFRTDQAISSVTGQAQQQAKNAKAKKPQDGAKATTKEVIAAHQTTGGKTANGADNWEDF
ncbi:methyl-accepting chemotaxis protein [Marinicaulis aureus]|uniref:Methyl-accepting chemotaxis protein n=1 Tax=Hyphococcus aureus TaxID=2666033 RepID=A0ABW1L3U9_9PROT